MTKSNRIAAPVAKAKASSNVAGAVVQTAGPTQTTGSSGVYAWGGHLIQTETKQDLRGRRLYTTFENMILNTCIVGSAIRYFQNLIGGTSWTAVAREDAGADGERAAEIVRQGLFEANMSTPWSLVIKKASLYKYYGFSMHEWAIRRRKDGMIVYNEIDHRPQYSIDMWNIASDGSPFDGVWQRVAGVPELFYVARNRMLYCVDNSLTDQPDGIGLLRHCADPARRLERFQQLEGFGFEGDLRGMPVARVPGAELVQEAMAKGITKDEDIAAYVNAKTLAPQQLIKNHVTSPFMGIVLDSAPYTTQSLGIGTQTPTVSTVPKWAIDIIKGASTGLPDVARTIERINREIARVLGMEFLMLGGDGKGSLALSEDKTSMFAAVMESTLDELSWFTLHDLVYPLLEMNGLDPEMTAPQIMPDPIATERIETTVDALQKLALAGAVLMPDDPAINQIRGRLHLADQPKITPELMGTMARARRGQPEPDPNADPNAEPGQTPANGDTKTTATDEKNTDGVKATKPKATKRGRWDRLPEPTAQKSTFRHRSR